MRNFQREVRAHLEDPLSKAGFAYEDGAFRRARGVLEDRLIFDNGGRNASRYRVLMGFAAPSVLPFTDGVIAEAYFTGGSVSRSPKEITCSTSAVLHSSLERLLVCLDSVVVPFFDSVQDAADLARKLEQPHEDYFRGLLFLAAGDADEGRGELLSYRNRLQRMSSDEQTLEAIKAVNDLLNSAEADQ